MSERDSSFVSELVSEFEREPRTYLVSTDCRNVLAQLRVQHRHDFYRSLGNYRHRAHQPPLSQPASLSLPSIATAAAAWSKVPRTIRQHRELVVVDCRFAVSSQSASVKADTQRLTHAISLVPLLERPTHTGRGDHRSLACRTLSRSLHGPASESAREPPHHHRSSSITHTRRCRGRLAHVAARPRTRCAAPS